MAPRLYDASLYRFDRSVGSYWEATAGEPVEGVSRLAGEHSCEVAIIGGGYTGLSAALHLGRDHGIRARVLEAGEIGWGASGRNAGFCSTGASAYSPSGLVRRFGVDDARAYYRSQIEAVGLVRDLLETEAIECQPTGECELEVAHTPAAFEALASDAAVMAQTLGRDVRLVPAGEFRERFYDAEEAHGALASRPCFGLHPLRYCRGLARAAMRYGATVHPSSEVVDWRQESGGRHRLLTPGGSLLADKVVFATNAFMPEGLNAGFYGRGMPVISAIIVTRPLREEELARHRWQNDQPTINSRRVLNYFRLLPDRRLLFGGRGHGDGANPGNTWSQLGQALGRMFPRWSDVEVEYRWQGLILFSRARLPSLGRLEGAQKTWYAFGYHGNGVNTATWCGSKIAEWIGTGSEPSLPAVIRGLPRRFPLPRFRRTYLRAALAAAQWLDGHG